MKKLIVGFILTCLLIALFAGCKGNDDKVKSETENALKTAEQHLNDMTDNLTNQEDSQPEPTKVIESQEDNEVLVEDDKPLVSDDFLMQIEDTFSISGRGAVATGRILSGSISAGSEIELISDDDKIMTVQAEQIEMFRKLVDSANTGDSVGILLSDLERKDLNVGDILVAKGGYSIHNSFLGTILFAEDKDEAFYKERYTSTCYFITGDTICAINFIDGTQNDDGTITAKVYMATAQPLMIGSTFEVRYMGNVLATGEVVSFDLDLDHELNSEDDESSTGIKVTLISSGANKVGVIKEIQEIYGYGLREAKEIIDNAPSVISQNVLEDEAKEIKIRLEDIGATVEITTENIELN
ncbi:MAG TPA: hypothetical protein GXZ90_00590 [Clostridiales bacterium]|nr:hypothetical protein [Clostridiales bacterium]